MRPVVGLLIGLLVAGSLSLALPAHGAASDEAPPEPLGSVSNTKVPPPKPAPAPAPAAAESSSFGWKSGVGVAAMGAGGVGLLASLASTAAGAFLLVTPQDEASLVGVGLFLGGVVGGVVSGATAAAGLALLAWDDAEDGSSAAPAPGP